MEDEKARELSDIRFILGVMIILLLKLLLDLPIREHRYFTYLNESGVTMLFGLLLGALGYLLSEVLHWTRVLSVNPTLYAEIFYLALLPPIIFNAGFTMKKREFFRNMGSILAFAVPGCAFSAIVIGICLFYGSKLGIRGLSSTDPIESFVFGSVLSSTDPVATLAIFQEMNVEPTLYSLVFGESVLNDAISIVLFRTCSQFIGRGISSKTISAGIQQFTITFFGSIAIGLVVSALGAIILKRLGKYMPAPYEIIVMISVAYLPYLLAEELQLSGIVALFVCSVMMSHYHWYSLSSDSQITMLNVSSSIAFFADSLVFLSVGLGAIFNTSYKENSWDPLFILYTFSVMLFSRFLMVFPFSFFLNFGRPSSKKITWRFQIVLWFAGLRGAIALILCLSLSNKIEGKDILINTTFVIVFITNIFIAPLTKPLIKFLGIKLCLSNVNVRTIEDDFTEEGEIKETAYILKPRPKRRLHALWRKIDEEYVKPWLGGRQRKESERALYHVQSEYETMFLSIKPQENQLKNVWS